MTSKSAARSYTSANIRRWRCGPTSAISAAVMLIAQRRGDHGLQGRQRARRRGGEQGDIVAGGGEPVTEVGDDPLRTSVRGGRHVFVERGQLSDAHQEASFAVRLQWSQIAEAGSIPQPALGTGVRGRRQGHQGRLAQPGHRTAKIEVGTEIGGRRGLHGGSLPGHVSGQSPQFRGFWSPNRSPAAARLATFVAPLDAHADSVPAVGGPAVLTVVEGRALRHQRSRRRHTEAASTASCTTDRRHLSRFVITVDGGLADSHRQQHPHSVRGARRRTG